MKTAINVVRYANVPVFLIPIFFLLHGYNEHFNLLSFDVVFSLWVKYFMTALAIFLCATILLPIQKATIFSIYILLIYFFFGWFHDSIRTIIPSFLTPYSVVLPTMGILIICLFFILKYKKFYVIKQIVYFTWFFILTILLELILLGYYVICEKNNTSLLIPKQDEGAFSKKSIQLENKPDIYFIVFDEYTSTQCLKREFGFENPIDSFLKNHSFFISSRSQSNYNKTTFSIGSTLNLGYLHFPNSYLLTANDMLSGFKTIEQNYLTRFLFINGYDIINNGVFDVAQKKAQSIYFSEHFLSALIDNQTLISRIKRDIWWNFSTKELFTNKFQIPASYERQKKVHLKRNEDNFKSTILELTDTNNINPRFVYTHLILPHEPFYLQHDGSMRSDESIIKNSFSEREAYIQQVEYANTLIKKIVEVGTALSKRPKVIIIEGDHGFRSYPKHEAPKKEFFNLNTIYFSDKDYSSLYDGISPVNTFRVILNKYFRSAFPLLKDSSFFLIDPEFDFRKK